MNSFPPILPYRIRGFSLVELMVGMTIGFIAIVIIMQSLSVFESHKRTTTAGVDAQENGLLALMKIEADIRKAAVGVNHPALLSCQNFFSYYQDVSGTGVPPATVIPTPFASLMTIPVIITDGAKADTISIRSGMRVAGAAPTELSADMQASSDRIKIQVYRAYDLNGEPESADDPPADLILAANSGNCSLMRITSKVGNELTIQNVPGSLNEYNAPVSYMTSNNWPGYGSTTYPAGSSLFRVGSVGIGGIKYVNYSVDASSQLIVEAGATGAAEEKSIVASEIVALQAQYGVAPAGGKSINEWVDPTSGSSWAPGTLGSSPVNIQRIKAIRVAVVARSSQRDGALVSSPCSDEEGNVLYYGPCSWQGGPAVTLGSADDTEWQHYRYRVYQTVVPMRNLLWPDL
ncbi:MAG: PilW family protein [Propionivibrio sp.]